MTARLAKGALLLSAVSAVTAIAMALPGCAHADAMGGGDDARDAVLDDLSDAFADLRSADHDGAHRSLARATAQFDDLHLDGGALEEALMSDADKPYRGRPFERVLAEVTLAALDIERGRCDLALPTLLQAAFLDAKANPKDASDAVVVHALTLRCLVHTKASDGDVVRARDALRTAVGATGGSADVADEVEALALRDDAALAFDGTGPSVRLDGDAGERAVIVPSTAPAPAQVLAAAVPDDAVIVRLGDATTPVAATPARADAFAPGRGLVVWSSTAHATSVHGRPFTEVLQQRAAFRAQSLAKGRARIRAASMTTRRDAGSALAAAYLASSGATLTALAAATDARADDRCVEGLFERIVLVRN